MPYASDAQRRKFHYLESKGEISHATVHEFDEASKGKKLPEHVGKMKEQDESNISFLLLDKMFFETKEDARAWAEKHDFRVAKVHDDQSEWMIKLRRPSKDEATTNIHLAQGVTAAVIRPRDLLGFARTSVYAGQGASPAPYDPIPDFGDIYYQPEDDPRREDESENAANRRRAMGMANRGKYGFHGTGEVSNAPILRYTDDDFPVLERRDDNVRADPPTPNRYTQPIPEKPKLVIQEKEARIPTLPPGNRPRVPHKPKLVIGPMGKIGETEPEEADEQKPLGRFRDPNKPSTEPKLTIAPHLVKQPKASTRPSVVKDKPFVQDKQLSDRPASSKRMGG